MKLEVFCIAHSHLSLMNYFNFQRRHTAANVAPNAAATSTLQGSVASQDASMEQDCDKEPVSVVSTMTYSSS